VQLLDPLAGLAGLSLLAIVVMYFLRARRPPRQVPSTLWWRPLTLDRQAAAPWQRIRPSWLLLLQLLAAALVVGALLQPAFASAQSLTGQTIVIIDTSATMQATDVRPSRFAAAVDDARSLVDRLGPRARMTIVAMGPQPSVVATGNGSNRQPLLSALSQLRPTDGPADLQDALQLAVAAAGPHASGAHLVVLSDGITEPLSEPVTLPFPYLYKRIGISGENAGVTALSVVPGVAGESAVAHLQNFGQVPEQLTAELYVDGDLTDARAVHLGPGGGEDVSFSLPPGASYVRVLLVPHDAFPLDQVAVAVATPPQKLRVLLVSAGDVFLQQALALRPGSQVETETPSQWRQSQADDPAIDLFVFDGFVPAQLPSSAPYLVVGPPANRELGTGPALSPGPLLPASANNPLLYDVNLADVDVAESSNMSRSSFGNVVITSAGGPVLMVRPATSGSPAAALLGVYLHDSNLVLRSAFPILLTHLSEYLAPGTVPSPGQVPGTPVSIVPGPGASEVTVTPPSGRPQVLWRAKAGSPTPGSLLFTRTAEVGLYRVEVRHQDGTASVSYFATNVAAQSIAPAQSIPVVGTPGKALPTSSLYKSAWPWFAAAALALLLAEWVVYHRAS
jgi:hypothetical protein